MFGCRRPNYNWRWEENEMELLNRIENTTVVASLVRINVLLLGSCSALYVYVKFRPNYDRLRVEKALGNFQKFHNNNNNKNNNNNVRIAHGDRFRV